MCSLLKFFLIAFCFATTASTKFRFDYEYHPNIDGWLKLHLIPATWQDAFRRCDGEGTVLASPKDKKMMSAITSHMKTSIKNEWRIFTGVHATFSKGDFFSIEGISLAKMPIFWAKGEPDNADNNEDCILFLDDGTIADVNCTESFPFMCFKKETKDMIMTSCGTVDKDYELNPATGNCYKVHKVGKTWRQAYKTCAAEGGYLAIINSQEEAEFLKQIYKKNYVKIYGSHEVLLLGFHDWGEHGVWRTIHGLMLDEAGYAAWDNYQPNNMTGGQFCGGMSRNAKLNDFWCERRAQFVCEKSPDSLLDDFTLL